MKYKNKKRLTLGISLFLLVFLYIFKNYSSIILIADAIVALWIFYFIDSAFKMNFKDRHYGYFFILIILGILFAPLYFISTAFDKTLHLLMPLLVSIMVYYILDTKTKLGFKWKLGLTFLSVIALLSLWEIGEYIADYFWDFKMQGVYLRDITGLEKYKLVIDKNDDTMIDLILGTAGTIIFVIGKTITNLFNKKSKKKK
tara:strand:+ start:19979 stop:20578 length:600 start_codon:yes stop_codon:yes gene_type:complete